MPIEVQLKTPDAIYNGYETQGVAQFKNVPFGIIPGRFQPPRMAANVGSFDCTQQGPICPQDELYSDAYLGVDPERVREIEFNVQEFDCLNLMITGPKVWGGEGGRQVDGQVVGEGNREGDRQSEQGGANNPTDPKPTDPIFSGLPTVVWVHGGSNCMGTAYRGVNDPLNWVKRGIETGKPFIVVTIQFRVHLFGFLPFKGVGNYGLMDQKLAIDWVAQNIHHWGGDPGKISVFGQSSGSACVYAQTCHPERLFQQAAYLSGSIGEFRSRTLEDYAEISEKICTVLQCSIDDLATVPWQSLVHAFKQTGVQVLSPVNDGVFLPLNGYTEPSPPIARVLVSDCRQDGWFFMDGVPEGALVKLVAPYLNKNLSVSTNEDVCRVLTGRIFFRGNYKTARQLETQGTSVFTQCFDAINPLKPSLGNNHMVELFYSLEAYKLPNKCGELCRAVQDKWIKFVHFEDPWPQDSFALVTDTVEIKSLQQLPRHRDFSALELEMDFDLIRKAVTGW